MVRQIHRCLGPDDGNGNESNQESKFDFVALWCVARENFGWVKNSKIDFSLARNTMVKI